MIQLAFERRNRGKSSKVLSQVDSPNKIIPISIKILQFIFGLANNNQPKNPINNTSCLSLTGNNSIFSFGNGPSFFLGGIRSS